MKSTHLPRIHMACGADNVRPALAFIQITKRYIFATNAHIAVRHLTEDVLPAEIISALPDVCYIHKNNWKLMVKHLALEYVNGNIEVVQDGYRDIVPVLVDVEGYPEGVNKRIEERHPQEQVTSLGINVGLLDKLVQAMFAKDQMDSVVMAFDTNRTAIHIKPIEYGCMQRGIIMPATIVEQ